jgi:hypothetical protein
MGHSPALNGYIRQGNVRVFKACVCGVLYEANNNIRPGMLNLPWILPVQESGLTKWRRGAFYGI